MKQELTNQLWQAACNGDRSALEQLLRQLQDLIYRFCLSQLRDEAAAVEATQDTAMRLIENLESYSARSRVTTWTLGIALNVCRESRRRDRKWSTGHSDFELERPVSDFDPLTGNETQQELWRAIEELSDRQREAVALRYFEALSVKDTAAVMGVSVGTVKATLNQAIAKLRKKLNPTD